MDFKLTNKQLMLRKVTREFAEEFIAPVAQESDLQSQLDPTVMEHMKRMNYFGTCIPKEYGGSGLNTLEFAIVTEEIGRIDASWSITTAVHCSVVARPIFNFGSEEQKQEFLIPLAKGEKLGAFALTEANAGSDMRGIETTAILDGDEWILNGNKIFATNGGIAQIILVVAKVIDSGVNNGMTIFIVDADTPGYSVGVKEDKLGVRASNTSELIFQDARIPKENVLGGVGKGSKMGLQIINYGRILMAAQCVGLGQASLEAAVKYANERIQFGRPIAKFQSIQFKIADMGVEVESGRLLTYKAAEMCDNNEEDFGVFASMAKLKASEAAMQASHDAVQIHGGYGIMKAYSVERYYRDAKIAEIYEGTSDIMRLVIAQRLLRKNF